MKNYNSTHANLQYFFNILHKDENLALRCVVDVHC